LIFEEVENLLILAAGGDGTFGWLQSAIDEANMKYRPTVGHFALGTGNDMSRSLGFGNLFDL
jgi:diacylglycerol kinase (ATP)